MNYDDLIYQERPVYTKHGRMKRSERAKQFAPYAALKGYEKAIQQQEIQFTPKKILSENRKEELDRLLRQVQTGDTIKVTYYTSGAYQKIEGAVGKIDANGHALFVDGKRIPVEAIFDVTGENLI